MGCHGEIIWLEDHFLSYQKNEAGHPEKIIAYTINVTSQCEKESHIRRLEERNRKIIEALPEFIFIFDNNFFITDVLMAPDTVLLHPVDVLKAWQTMYQLAYIGMLKRNLLWLSIYSFGILMNV